MFFCRKLSLLLHIFLKKLLPLRLILISKIKLIQGSSLPELFLGNSSECPPPGNAPDDTVCVDLGKCKDGGCVPFCEREKNLSSCACNGKENAQLASPPPQLLPVFSSAQAHVLEN